MCVTLAWPRDVVPAMAGMVLAGLEPSVALPAGGPTLTAGWLCAVLCQRGTDYYVFAFEVCPVIINTHSIHIHSAVVCSTRPKVHVSLRWLMMT